MTRSPRLPPAIAVLFACQAGAATSLRGPSCPAPEPITCGQILAGELDAATDCPLLVNGQADGTVADAYTVTLETARQVTIELRSSAFDPFLYLRNGAGEEIGFDDDSGAGNDALLSLEAPLFDEYTILANSFFPGGEGAYTLSLQCSPQLPDFLFEDGFEGDDPAPP